MAPPLTLGGVVIHVRNIHQFDGVRGEGRAHVLGPVLPLHGEGGRGNRFRLSVPLHHLQESEMSHSATLGASSVNRGD